MVNLCSATVVKRCLVVGTPTLEGAAAPRPLPSFHSFFSRTGALVPICRESGDVGILFLLNIRYTKLRTQKTHPRTSPSPHSSLFEQGVTHKLYFYSLSVRRQIRLLLQPRTAICWVTFCLLEFVLNPTLDDTQ